MSTKASLNNAGFSISWPPAAVSGLVTRAGRARLVHAASIRRILTIMLVISACNIGLQVMSLVQSLMGLSPITGSLWVTVGLLSLFLLPLGLLAFRRWAIRAGWSILYAQDLVLLDFVVGQIQPEKAFPVRRIPMPLQRHLAGAIIKQGWLTWNDVRHCVRMAGLPEPDLSPVMAMTGRRPATRSDLMTELSKEAWADAWSLARLACRTSPPSAPRLVPVSRF